MSAQGTVGRTARRMAALLAVAALAGCAYGSPFGRFRDAEGAGVESAAYPSLLEARQKAQALGPSPDPAVGEGVVADLDVEAAVSAEMSARVAVPVVDVPALRREAQAVRDAAR